MTDKREFSQDKHDFHKKMFNSQMRELRDYLSAKRTLGFETPSRDEKSDQIFAAAFYIAGLLDGYSIAQAREVLNEASRQLEVSHQASARSLHSLIE